MLTAKDLSNHIKNNLKDKQVIIDSWLKDKVFPNFVENGRCFDAGELVPTYLYPFTTKRRIRS